jgi:hypothetical protein
VVDFGEDERCEGRGIGGSGCCMFRQDSSIMSNAGTSIKESVGLFGEDGAEVVTKAEALLEKTRKPCLLSLSAALSSTAYV